MTEGETTTDAPAMSPIKPDAEVDNGQWSDGVMQVECWVAEDALQLLQRQIDSGRMSNNTPKGRIWRMERELFERLRTLTDDRSMILVGSGVDGPYRRTVVRHSSEPDLDELF